jgi:two-component system, OmpR family, KDP operon response regulator KdpE
VPCFTSLCRSAMSDDILIVEDEPSTARVLQVALEARGYEVRIAIDGRSALAAAQRKEPSVVLLDLRLPDMDGFQVFDQLRRFSTSSVIVLTADGAEDRKIVALDGGAVDYITKPFSVDELMARIRVAQRHRRALSQVLEDQIITVGTLRVDVAGHVAEDGERDLELTAKEFKLLVLLARNSGRVLTHGYLLDQLWEGTSGGRAESLRVLVNQLRRKLGDDRAHQRLVTESGVGYRLVEGAVTPTSRRMIERTSGPNQVANRRGTG